MTSVKLIHEVADKLAQELNQRQTDPNEVASVLAMVRRTEKGEDLFRYLDTVVQDGRAVVRSGQTLDYYRDIRTACRRHLEAYQDQPKKLAEILGWTVRLMRYHKVSRRLEQPPARVERATPARTPTRPKPEQQVGRQTGQIDRFLPDRHFGFIKPDRGGRNIFFHESQLPSNFKSPPKGAHVSFIIGKDAQGRDQAQDVQPR